MGTEPTDAGRAVDLETALDELYATPPRDFVATRTRLARALRDTGDTGAAKTLGRARRPTKTAAALNLLARRQPDVVAGLLDRSAELRDAQAAALAGDPGSQRDAIRAHREALAATADAAVALVDGTGDSARAEILATLQVATAEESFAALLRAGRLEHAEARATGFPTDLGGFAPPPDELAARRSRRDEAARVSLAEREAQEEADREAERARARAELAEAEAALVAATTASETAAAAVVTAEEHVAAVQADLEAARAVLRTAKDRAGAATREQARLERDVARRRRG